MTDSSTPATFDFVPTDLRPTAGLSGAAPEFAELSLILPHWQIDALERAARRLGLTTAQLLRRVIGEYFDGPYSD
jgi:hypothetical protein